MKPNNEYVLLYFNMYITFYLIVCFRDSFNIVYLKKKNTNIILLLTTSFYICLTLWVNLSNTCVLNNLFLLNDMYRQALKKFWILFKLIYLYASSIDCNRTRAASVLVVPFSSNVFRWLEYIYHLTSRRDWFDFQ